MADLKSNIITSFTGGELGPNLAGRVDVEDLKTGFRFAENFIPEPQGGLKKFYGTRKISEIYSAGDCVLVPFDGAVEPMALLFTSDKLFCVTERDVTDTGIFVQTTNVVGASYLQINDVIKFASTNGLFDINYTGVSEGKHSFTLTTPEFVEVPYFPLGWSGNFNHSVVSSGGGASDSSKEFTLKISSADNVFSLELPPILVGAANSKNVISEHSTAIVLNRGYNNASQYTVSPGDMTLEFVRIRDDKEEVLLSGVISNRTDLKYLIFSNY